MLDKLPEGLILKLVHLVGDNTVINSQNCFCIQSQKAYH